MDMTTLRKLACATLLFAAAGMPAWAAASRDDAAAIAQRETGGGRVLSIERSDAGGRAVWRVKVVTARGEVRVVLVDVATGRTQ